MRLGFCKKTEIQCHENRQETALNLRAYWQNHLDICQLTFIDWKERY